MTMSARVPGLDASRLILDALSQPVIVSGLDRLILHRNPAAGLF